MKLIDVLLIYKNCIHAAWIFRKLKKDQAVSEKYLGQRVELEATMFSQQEVLGLRTFLSALSALCVPEMYLLVEEATLVAEGI